MKKKEINLIKGNDHIKKENKGGEKIDSSDDKFGFVNKKAVQKIYSSDDDFEEYKSASRDYDFEEK
jgi:hypothetical protein